MCQKVTTIDRNRLRDVNTVLNKNRKCIPARRRTGYMLTQFLHRDPCDQQESASA